MCVDRKQGFDCICKCGYVKIDGECGKFIFLSDAYHMAQKNNGANSFWFLIRPNNQKSNYLNDKSGISFVQFLSTHNANNACIKNNYTVLILNPRIEFTISLTMVHPIGGPWITDTSKQALILYFTKLCERPISQKPKNEHLWNVV